MSAHPEPPPFPRVLVAVLTYRRPSGLAAVLPALVEQLRDADLAGAVLVVDNDPDASAREAVAAWSPCGVIYAHEPRPGIAAARNRALAAAATADAIVFIDDDEVPAAGWLRALVGYWRATGVTAVAGPVLSVFSGPVDPWILAGEFFARPRRRTGTTLGGAATNNLLLDVRRLRALGLRFDDAFGLTGGSDTMLTHALVKRGERIVWCDEAVVEESVPPERTTRRWVLRRHLRAGNVWSRVALALAAPGRRRVAERLDLTVRLSFRLMSGMVGWLFGTLTGTLSRRACGARDVASGLGGLSGVFGYVYVEYKREVAR